MFFDALGLNVGITCIKYEECVILEEMCYIRTVRMINLTLYYNRYIKKGYRWLYFFPETQYDITRRESGKVCIACLFQVSIL